MSKPKKAASKPKVTKKKEPGFVHKAVAFMAKLLHISYKSSLFGAKLTAYAFVTLLVSVFAPEVHNLYLRSTVGSSVVHIKVKQNGKWHHQGTGFHVRGPSGKVYVLTNRHVCEGAENGSLFVLPSSQERKEESYKEVKIVSRYEDGDICLADPYPNAKPIPMGSPLARGSKIYVVGHPTGLPMTVTQGEVISADLIVIEQLITSKEEENECKYKNSKIIKRQVTSALEAFMSGGEQVKVCRTVDKCIMTSAQIKPGSSGSPVVTSTGRLAGIMFASVMDGSGWGSYVPLESIADFLQDK